MVPPSPPKSLSGSFVHPRKPLRFVHPKEHLIDPEESIHSDRKGKNTDLVGKVEDDLVLLGHRHVHAEPGGLSLSVGRKGRKDR